MNEDVNGDRNMFWKEVRNAKGEKVESCTRIKDGNAELCGGRVYVKGLMKASYGGLAMRKGLPRESM